MANLSNLSIPISPISKTGRCDDLPGIEMEKSDREAVKKPTEQNLNVIMDLNLDGTIRWVSSSWRDVIGTEPDTVKNVPIESILVGCSPCFNDSVESMRKNDSRSQIVRFSVNMGPHSALRQISSSDTKDLSSKYADSENHTLRLEAQGIMIYDCISGRESHTMWMVRPSVFREVTIDLPEVLVESLGVGAEVLAQYLSTLAEHSENDDRKIPPSPVLCRICERMITPWWFEKHSEVCLQEHQSEMEVQIAHEALCDHRNAIVKVIDALEAARISAGPVDITPENVSRPEYKGLPIMPSSILSSGIFSSKELSSQPMSGIRERSVSGFNHRKVRSFAVRRPVARIVELVLDLCDTAIEINTPMLRDNRGTVATELRTQSPQSENRISQVLGWQSPTTENAEHEPGLSALCDDTSSLSRAKVDAIFRHRRIIEYSERLRVELDILVQECVEETLLKTARIAAGQSSDTSEDADEEQQQEADSDPETERTGQMIEEGIFTEPSCGHSSNIGTTMSNSFDVSLTAHVDRRTSSVAESTRSSSPRGGQISRLHPGPISMVPRGKRASMQIETETGADSDSSVRSSVFSGPRRADSSGSDVGFSRIANSRERKRRSMIMPVMLCARQQSPGRIQATPSSPLRISKPRIPSGVDLLHSPISSPVLSTVDFSPTISGSSHHRRQSSTTGSDILRAVSPRLIPISNPQPRAVPPSIKDFEIIKPISKGAFGSVYLSKKKSTGDYFAIKVLKKADMVAKNQVMNVKAERAIMMWQGESDFVAKLYWTFSSKDYLYLVMEYMNGGDLASLIKVLGALPEDWAKKYLAEVVLGVEHLHSRGIVHRDLKPDNLLIDQNGHLKLTDFGLSRMGLIGRQQRALQNKPDEIAPDLLKQGPFHRAISVDSSRSESFDLQGNHSPSQTPNLVAAHAVDIAQPPNFNLSRENSIGRDLSLRIGQRSDSGDIDGLQSMFRRIGIADDTTSQPYHSPIEEEAYGEEDRPSADKCTTQPRMSRSRSVTHCGTPPQISTMPPPPMALFDPKDSNRRFVGTPDYLAPETINGSGQDEISDWWSLGCILFECLYGYPPFHAETPDAVFQNILNRKIDWSGDDVCQISNEARDLINRSICINSNQRIGANADRKFESGGQEIRNHSWFKGINWDTIRDGEAPFVPASEDPENTEYFDARGATLHNFAAEFEDQGALSSSTPGADYPGRPHDALSRVRSHVSNMKRGLMPFHIPPHVRDGNRNRRLSEPLTPDDFGTFSFKNLNILEKANKGVIQKLRTEAVQAQNKLGSAMQSPTTSSPSPSLESSPVVQMPLKRTISSHKGHNRSSSPSMLCQGNSSPTHGSQLSSSLTVTSSVNNKLDCRKTSSNSSTLSQHNSSTSMQDK